MGFFTLIWNLLVNERQMKKSLVKVSESHFGYLESYDQVRQAKDESIWRQLGKISIKEALNLWFNTLNMMTERNYRSGLRRLVDLGLVEENLTLQQFSLINHEAVVDEIKLVTDWTEATKQARAAAYISFTGFLQRRSQGIISKAVANKEGTNKTFFKVREKVKTQALSTDQTRRFLSALETINSRDALIAKVILQGGKRKEEVLGLRTEFVNFDDNTITFKQSKTRGTEKVTTIHYPEHIFEDLHNYIGTRTGLVFITRNANRIAPYQIDRNFIKAGEKAQISFKVTPHVLRVTLVTRLKELRIQDSDIMKITGHASPAQLSAYDKTNLADNATLYHHFV